MLNLLRRGVKTWVAKVLFALLVVSFAIWGIGDVFGTSLGSSVATVGDQKISAERYASALNREVRAQAQRFGQPLDSEMVRAIGLDRQVLARMAQEATLDQAMEELGVSAPDDAVGKAIIEDPSFRGPNGAFDKDAYRYLIAQANFTVEDYEDATRRSIARSELARALSDGGLAPAGAVDAVYAFQTETRRFDHIELNGADHAGDVAAPDEAALAAYHDENAETFSAPERRDATFIHLDIAALGADYEPDEAAIEALYANRSDQYHLPETRELYQLVFDDKDEAEDAAKRIESGDTLFDALLALRGETRADTSLGEVKREDVLPAVADVAFGATKLGVVGPVDTGFGHALIDVTAITPARTVPLEDARPELVEELRREAALDLAPEKAGELQDMIAGGATLEEAAADMGLKVETVKGVDAEGHGAEGFAADPEFLTELFNATEGEERDMTETAAGEYFVLRVDAVEPARTLPLDEVRDQVEAAVMKERVLAALTDRADAIVARLDEGETLAAIAGELGVEVGSEGPKTRIVGWDAIPAELVETLFQGETGAAGQAPAGDDRIVVAQVVDIAEGEPTEANRDLRERLAAQMNEMAGNDALSLYITAKQREAGVTVNQPLLDSLLAQSGGY